MILRNILIVAFALITKLAFSQITVKGTILSEEDSLAIPGVSVTEKGTNNSVQASIDGYYSITVNDTSILVFSFVGMVTREVPVKGQGVINTTLKQAGIYEAWDQKLRFFVNSGLIENPVGGQFEFAVPTFINGLSVYGNCSYQTNLKENKYLDVGLKLNGVRLFHSSIFNYVWVGVESNYRHIILNNSTIETISFESVWWSTVPFDLILGYSQINNNSGLVLGTEFWIPKPIFAKVKGKVSFLNELLEYQAEIRKSFGRINSFVKYYNVDTYSEISIGIGIEFTYFFKYQRNEY